MQTPLSNNKSQKCKGHKKRDQLLISKVDFRLLSFQISQRAVKRNIFYFEVVKLILSCLRVDERSSGSYLGLDIFFSFLFREKS